MKLKTLSVLMLGLGAAITTSCGGGGRNLTYSDAHKFVEDNYTHDDLILIKWQTLNWDFSSSTGTNCTDAIKLMIDNASDYCLNVIEIKMKNQNIPGYRGDYYNLDWFEADFPTEQAAKDVNAAFVADGKKLTVTFDTVYYIAPGSPTIPCKETEFYGDDGRFIRSKYVFDAAFLDGQVNGWIEFVYNY